MVTIGSGNGLVADGTKLLSKPILTHRLSSTVAFTSKQVMADILKAQKSTACPHPICTIFGGRIKCIYVVISYAKCIDVLYYPVIHRGSNGVGRNIAEIKFVDMINIIGWNLTVLSEISKPHTWHDFLIS